jgi:hypothetical protein
MQVKDPPKSLNHKEKSQWNTSWARLPETEVSTKPIVPQNLFIFSNNKVMYMEQIFEDISEHMLETTYTLRLGQLLKIAPHLKKYMWQKLKPEKPNIVIKVIPKPNVAKMMETHFKVLTATIKKKNQMVLLKE